MNLCQLSVIFAVLFFVSLLFNEEYIFLETDSVVACTYFHLNEYVSSLVTRTPLQIVSLDDI